MSVAQPTAIRGGGGATAVSALTNRSRMMATHSYSSLISPSPRLSITCRHRIMPVYVKNVSRAFSFTNNVLPLQPAGVGGGDSGEKVGNHSGKVVVQYSLSVPIIKADTICYVTLLPACPAISAPYNP